MTDQEIEELERRDHKLTVAGIIFRAICDMIWWFAVCS